MEKAMYQGYKPLHSFRRILGFGGVALQITAKVWGIAQLSTSQFCCYTYDFDKKLS